MFASTTILIVRHGEKPGDPGTDASSDGPNLSPAGWQRAAAYVSYFGSFTASSVDGSKTKPVPVDYVFAAADDYLKSYRPRLTVSSFADDEATPRSFATAIADDDFSDLVTELESNAYDQKNILICWHHGKIIDLANALLTDNGKQKMPDLGTASCWPPHHAEWPPAVFGWLFQICFDSNGNVDVNWTRCLNEHLMPDDTQDPCSGWPTKSS